MYIKDFGQMIELYECGECREIFSGISTCEIGTVRKKE